MVGTLTDYSMIARDIDRSVTQVKSDPFVARETEYYLKNIGNVKSIDDFVNDRRLFQYAMKAHGLEDMAYAKGFMVKVLEGGRDDTDSLANKLSDQRYLEFAKTFDFNRYTTAATTFTRAQQGVVDKYLRQTLEENAGNSNQGVRLALYFQRKAPDISSVTAILADPALSQVLRVAFGLPDSFAAADLDHQVAMYEKQIDVADFADPDKLSKFIQRFTAMWDVANSSTSTAATNVGLLFGGTQSYGLSADLMLAIQKSK